MGIILLKQENKVVVARSQQWLSSNSVQQIRRINLNNEKRKLQPMKGRMKSVKKTKVKTWTNKYNVSGERVKELDIQWSGQNYERGYGCRIII